MDTDKKRTCTVYDIDEVCSYLKAAIAFNSAIYIKKSNNYHLLERTNISQVDIKDNFLVFNRELDLDSSIKQKISFRILLESCVIDFSTTLLPSSKSYDKSHEFLLPKQMTIHYIRKFLRTEPSKYHPVEIKLSKNKLLLKFKVLDISANGVAVKMQRAELLFEIGDIVDEMEILLTEQDRVRISGKIRYVKGDRCGIKFINNDPEAEELIKEYIDLRQLAERIRAKTYKDVEKELMLLKKIRQATN